MIGYAAAHSLARAGANLMLVDISAEGLGERRRMLEALGATLSRRLRGYASGHPAFRGRASLR